MSLKRSWTNDGLPTFLNNSAVNAARQLLGYLLVREIDGKTIRAIISETEAYDETDVASHSYRGETERTKVMFGDAGHLYVYFTYGMHYCCNVVVGEKGHGAAVLIRSIVPIEGEEHMIANRGGRSVDLSNGPAKVCQALLIDKTLNGHKLTESPLRLVPGEIVPDEDILQTTRIGISKGKEAPWRFLIRETLSESY